MSCSIWSCLPESATKTNDPVRLYLREMGAVPLLKREGEVEIARRIERGQNTVLRTLSRSPLVIQALLELGSQMRRDVALARELLQIPDPMPSEELLESKKEQFCVVCDDIAKLHKKVLQTRQKLLAVPRGIKPKQYRHLRWELGRLTVRISRLIRSVRLQSNVVRDLIGRVCLAVEEVKPIERELARLQRKIEACAGGTGRWHARASQGAAQPYAETAATGRAVRRIRHGVAPRRANHLALGRRGAESANRS